MTDPPTSTCRCGHTMAWHVVYAVDYRRGDSMTGRCNFTGPQPTDGCDCTEYRPDD